MIPSSGISPIIAIDTRLAANTVETRQNISVVIPVSQGQVDNPNILFKMQAIQTSGDDLSIVENENENLTSIRITRFA